MQLAVEQPLTGRYWNPSRKDTPHPRTKKKLQRNSRKGTIMIKSNPMPVRWATHKLENNNTKEVFPLLRSSRPYIRLLSLGIWTRDWESPGNLTLKASGI